MDQQTGVGIDSVSFAGETVQQLFPAIRSRYAVTLNR
jgi:hypothetical protein